MSDYETIKEQYAEIEQLRAENARLHRALRGEDEDVVRAIAKELEPNTNFPKVDAHIVLAIVRNALCAEEKS